MPGNEVLENWRAALVADAHGIPVLVIREGRIHEANVAARTFFANVEPGMDVCALFDESCREKIRAFLRERASGRAVELEVVQADRPPVAAKFLLLEMAGEQLLVRGSSGIGYTEDIGAKLVAANADFANLTRELAKAKDVERRLRLELEKLANASSAVVEAVADLPQADVSAVLLMIALQAQALTHADYVALGIGNDPEKPFDPWVYVGIPQSIARAIGHVPHPVGVFGRVAREGEIIRTQDLHRHPAFKGMPPHHPEMGSFLGVPIPHRGRFVGNLYLAKRPGSGEFTEEDERMMRMLAARVGAAIETASLYVTASLQRTWLQNVIDQMPDGVLLYDDRGRLKAMNQGAAPLSSEGSEGADPFGNPVVIDLRDQDGNPLPLERWPIFRVLHDREVVAREEMVVRRRSGELIPVAVSAGPVRDAAGDVSGGMMIVQDISDRKALERLREEWAAVVAHDLRQPVNTITFATEMLLRHGKRELPERERRALGRIGSASHRLNRMISDLLDASRIESNRLTIDSQPIELGTFLDSVVDSLGDVVAGHVVRVIAPAEQVVSIDPDRIHQVLGNLISNAAKYGSADTDIVVRAMPQDEWVEVVVENKGPGIPADQIPLLFSRFTRTRGARETGIAGIGLGLYITRGLVEAHGGRLWVESAPGEITRFHFTLPRPPRSALVLSESAPHPVH